MRADRHTDKQTDRHNHYNTLQPYQDEVTNNTTQHRRALLVTDGAVSTAQRAIKWWRAQCSPRARMGLLLVTMNTWRCCKCYHY